MKLCGSQWVKMKNKIILSLIVVMAFGGMVNFFKHYKETPCVNIYVDFGSLDHNKKISECVPAESKIKALNVLKRGKIDVNGTQRYGLQVVCRVNGLPDGRQEKGLKMPPESAYWAVLVKKSTSVLDPMPKWGWADKGVSSLYLNPGESIGLVFSKNGKFKWPN